MPILNAAHGWLRNTVLSSNRFLGSCVAHNQCDLLGGEFRKAVPFSCLPSSMKEFVSVIPLAGVPAKIIKSAISSIAVVVRALHSVWTRPEKCCGNQQVNIGAVPHPISAKVDAQITALTDERRQQFAANRSRPTSPRIAYPVFTTNPPKTADGKQTLQTDYRTPFLMNIFHKLNYTINSHQQQLVYNLKGGY